MFFRKRRLTRGRLSWMTSWFVHLNLVALLILEVGGRVILLPGPPPHGSASRNIIHLAGEFVPRTEAEEQAAAAPPIHLAVLTPAEATTGDEALPHDAQPVAGAVIREQVAAAVESAQKLPRAEQEQRAAELAERLNTISNAENVDGMVGVLSKTLGTKERASAPGKVAPPGDIDYSTAQIHEVRRETDAQGSWTYIVVLVDREGRSAESPMDEDEGRQAYDTMQLIKKNPLLERIYRGVMMGLLDKLAQ